MPELKPNNPDGFDVDLWENADIYDIEDEDVARQRNALNLAIQRMNNMIEMLMIKEEKDEARIKEYRDKMSKLEELIKLENDKLKEAITKELQTKDLPLTAIALDTMLEVIIKKPYTEYLAKAKAWVKKNITRRKSTASQPGSQSGEAKTSSSGNQEQQGVPKAEEISRPVDPSPSAPPPPPSQRDVQEDDEEDHDDFHSHISVSPQLHKMMEEVAREALNSRANVDKMCESIKNYVEIQNHKSLGVETTNLDLDYGTKRVMADVNNFNDETIAENYSDGVTTMLRKVPKPGNTELQAAVNKSLLTSMGCLSEPLDDNTEVYRSELTLYQESYSKFRDQYQ